MFKWFKNISFKYDTDKYENILDDHNNKFGELINNFLSLVIILFVFVLSFETLGNNSYIYKIELFIFDGIISIIFAMEYLYRFLRSREKIIFIFSFKRIIDLLSFLPFFLGLVTVGEFLKILRMLRVLKVLRLFRRIPHTEVFIKSLKDYKNEFRVVLLYFFVILFVFSSFVFYFESTVIGTKFTSMPITLRWGIVTMATVGYGDMYPVTNMGKILGSFLVFLGPVMLALISAVIIMVFMETSRILETTHKHIRGRICDRCKTGNTKDSNYCMKCGEKLFNDELDLE